MELVSFSEIRLQMRKSPDEERFNTSFIDSFGTVHISVFKRVRHPMIRPVHGFVQTHEGHLEYFQVSDLITSWTVSHKLTILSLRTSEIKYLRNIYLYAFPPPPLF